MQEWEHVIGPATHDGLHSLRVMIPAFIRERDDLPEYKNAVSLVELGHAGWQLCAVYHIGTALFAALKRPVEPSETHKTEPLQAETQEV
jgi:hypothetical protein